MTMEMGFDSGRRQRASDVNLLAKSAHPGLPAASLYLLPVEVVRRPPSIRRASTCLSSQARDGSREGYCVER